MPRRLIRTAVFYLGVLAVLVTGLTATAHAQDASSLAASLSASSPLVVTGRVAAIESRWDPSANAIYTYVTVTVTERLKGTLTEPQVVVKQMGGQVGDIGLRIDDQARYTVGEDVLVFLAVRPRDGTLYPAGFELGKWRLLTDLSSGQTRAVPPSAAQSHLAGPAAATAGQGLDLAGVRAIAGASAPVNRPFVTRPAETRLASPAWAPLPTGGAPARWHAVDDGAHIQVQVAPPPPGLPGGEAEFLAAMALWSNGGTRLTLDFFNGGSVPACATFTGDRRIAVYASDNVCGEIGDPNSTGIGGGYFTAGDRRTINGTTYDAYIQGIVIINNTGPHLSSPGCFQDALTHNLGHAIGLGHTDSVGALMQPLVACAGAPHSLGADDISGLRAIYPNVASGGAPPQAPTAMNANALVNTVTLTWTPSGSGGPAASYIIEAGTAPGLANITTITVPGSTTSLVVNDVPIGTYYVRIKARNVLGTSGYSPTAAVTVGVCTPPGPPGPINYSVNDQTVSLSWTAPASGGPAQNYILGVGSAPGGLDILISTYPASVTNLVTAAPYGNYYVKLAATNVCGMSAPTAEVLIQVQPCTVQPNAPTGLTFGRAGNQVTFNWAAPGGGGAPSQYVLVAGSQPGAGDLAILPTNSAATSFVAVGPPGTYYVKVFAANPCGNSAYSNEVVVAIP